MPEPGARRRRGDWRYRAWRQAELALLVDEPGCVQTTAVAVDEADPAVACVAQTDDLLERLEPRLRRVIQARAEAGDAAAITRALFATLRVLARAEPRERLFAPSRTHRHTALAVLFLHDEITPAAAPVSRGRFYQLVDITLLRWGRARFPALVAWCWAARRVAWRGAPQAPAPPPDAAPPPPTPAGIAAAVPVGRVDGRRPDPDRAEWLRILRSVRPVAHA